MSGHTPKAKPTREEYLEATALHAIASAELAKLELTIANGYPLHGPAEVRDDADVVFRTFVNQQTETPLVPRPDFVAAALARIIWPDPKDLERAIFVLCDKLSDRMPSAVKALPRQVRAAVEAWIADRDLTGDEGLYTRYGDAKASVRAAAVSSGSRVIEPGEKPEKSPAFKPICDWPEKDLKLFKTSKSGAKKK